MKPAERLASLTAKQRAVIDLLLEGKTRHEISAVTGSSRANVDGVREFAFGKLGVATMTELHAFARSAGIGPKVGGTD